MPRPAFGDAALENTVALPNGAATVVGAGIEVGITERGEFPGCVEVKIEAPALVVGDLGNGATIKYSIVTEDCEPGDFYAPTVLLPDVLVQTGAGGVGAGATSWQGRLPAAGVLKSIGLKAVNSAAGDASDKSATLSLKF